MMAGESCDYSFNLGLFGATGCGKTSIVSRYARDEFSSEYIPTFGVYGEDIYITNDIKRVKLRIREFRSGGWFYDPFRSPTMLVYDITAEESFEYIRICLEHVNKYRRNGAKLVLVGNKLDKADERKVSRDSGEKMASDNGMMFMEISAKTDASVQLLFNTMVDANVEHVWQAAVREKKSLQGNNLLTRIFSPIFGKTETDNLVPEEIMQDPYALDLYVQALRDGKENDRSIRVNIVGNYRQGKTSLMRQLVGMEMKDIKSTNGIDIDRLVCYRTKDGKLSFRNTYENDSTGIIERLVSVALTKDVDVDNRPGNWRVFTPQRIQSPFTMETEQHTLVNKDKEQAAVKENANEENANKDRNTSETSETDQAKQFLRSDDISASKNSVLSVKEKGAFAKAIKANKSSDSITENQTSFDIWDFGGQFVFYATHTIFHSKRAIYLVVFDLSKELNKPVTDNEFPSESSEHDMEYFLRFWMSSIHSFVGSEDGFEPKVILVGTHKDKIKGNVEMKQKYINKYFDDVRELFDGTVLLNHIHPVDFAVNNNDRNDEAIVELRETIVNVRKEVTKNVEIPAKWIQLEKSLRTRIHMKVIPLQLVLAIDAENEFPLGEAEQVKLFLRYHHGKGTIVYFDEEPLSEFVVLDPQYLIDAFKSIITCERFCTNDPEIRPLWKMLLTNGRLEKHLIDKQWGKPEDTSKGYIQNKNILLAFLTKHHIISEATTFDEAKKASTGLGWYVVPSLLRDNSRKKDVVPFLQGKQQTKLRIVILFGNSPIVPTVYHRFIAAAIGKWPIAQTGSKVLIFKDICIVRLNLNHAGIAEMKLDCIELTVVNLCPASQVDSQQTDSFRRFSESVISHEFLKLRSKSEDYTKPYTIVYRCNHESHGAEGSIKIMTIEELNDDKILPCPDLTNHDICADIARTEWFQNNRKALNFPIIQLNDKLMSWISQCVGSNWQLLGYDLGLTQVQIEQITENHPNSASLRIYYMLRFWCNNMADSGTMNLLVQAMQRCPNVTIDWDEIRNIVDGVVL